MDFCRVLKKRTPKGTRDSCPFWGLKLSVLVHFFSPRFGLRLWFWVVWGGFGVVVLPGVVCGGFCGGLGSEREVMFFFVFFLFFSIQ